MSVIVRSGINHCHFGARQAASDDIGSCTCEGEWPRIVGDHALNQRGDLIAPPVGEVELTEIGDHGQPPCVCESSSRFSTKESGSHHSRTRE